MNKELIKPLSSLEQVVAFNSRDWAQSRTDAFIYGIICGWSQDEDEVGAWDEICAKHNFDKKRLKTLHKNFKTLMKYESEVFGS